MRRRLLAWAGAAAVLLLASCTTVQVESQALIDQGNVREGMARLEQAMRERPGDHVLRTEYFRIRDRAITQLLAQASAEAGAGHADAAGALFGQALQLDPNNARAAAGVASIENARRHQQQADNAKSRLANGDFAGADLMVKAILSENPNHPQARELDRDLRERERQKAVTVPALKSKLQAPVNLEFRDAPLRIVMEALQRTAGINFILDRDIRPDVKATIFVKNVRVEDAIDLILQNNQLEKKVLTENTILIYPATQQKLREHQELVIRTFQIGNADPKQTVAMLRTMLKTKDIFVDERVNMIVMRDTPDIIRAAERLIAAQDMPDGEVVLELEILEVSRSKVRELGITYPSEFGGGLIGFGSRITRALEFDPGVKLKLLRTDGETKTLANPRVRVRNREKARVHIGDRVPVISSTIVGTTNSSGSANSAPVTTEQIQYIDVGIKIEAEPTIYPDDTVAVRINLDVSSLGTKTTTNAGSVAYEVGTRNANTVLRLKDGETQALMGLIRDEDVLSRTGIPFVGELPLLDMIFGARTTERRSRELVLLITPQLIRGIRPPDATLAEFWSGTESAMRLRVPVVQQLAEPDKKAAAPGRGGAAATLAADAPPPPPPLVPLAVTWTVPPKLKAGQEFMIELRGNSPGALKSTSVQLRYNPAELEVLAVDKAGFFKPGSGTTVYTPNIDASMGIVSASIAVADADAAPGDGGLLQLRAKMRAPATKTQLQITHVVGIDPANRRVPVQGGLPLDIAVEP